MSLSSNLLTFEGERERRPSIKHYILLARNNNRCGRIGDMFEKLKQTAREIFFVRVTFPELTDEQKLKAGGDRLLTRSMTFEEQNELMAENRRLRKKIWEKKYGRG